VFIWYIFPVLVSCIKKILATLPGFKTMERRHTDTKIQDGQRKGEREKIPEW
jgi:hypothetical protein